MARDEYGIYRKPTGSIIAAWLGIAAAIFFGAYAVKMREHLQTEKQRVEKAEEETNQIKIELAKQLGKLQALQNELQNIQTQNRDQTATAGGSSAPAPVESATTAARAPGEQTPAAASLAAALPAPAPEEQKNTTAVPALPEVPNANDAAPAAPEVATLPAKAEPDQAALAEASRLSGEILYYNPDTRKVYLSLGSALGGLQKGNRFTVWRGDQYVTDIRVEKVFSSTSTCEIEGPTPIGVRAGDIAKMAIKRSGT